MNSTTLTTIIGIGQAIGLSVADYLAHTSIEGGAMKQPTFWILLIVAALMGLKGYYTQGVAKPASPATTSPSQQPEAPKV